MKKSLWMLLLLIVIVGVFAAGCAAEEPAPAPEPATEGEAPEEPAEPAVEFPEMNLNMSVSTSDTSSWYKGGEYFGELLSERTGGKVTVTVYANEQLSSGSQTKGIEQLQTGVTDLSFHSTIIYSILAPEFGVISLPWLLPNEEAADAALAGAGGDAINEILLANNVMPLGFGENGFRQITNNVREIKTPADMEGLKIRIPGINMYIDLYKELGADPTSMNFSEVFTSLQQGTIDGQENPLSIITTSKLYEVQKYISLWNYSYDPIALGMNKDLFDSMSPELQAIFVEAGQEATEYQKQLNREEGAAAVELLEGEGMVVTALTDEEIAVFQEKMIPVYEKYEEIIGKELIDAFRE
ncbi:MAG: C4-dicarboxylate ABC transporter substrate-binding protein [delta proteobacterium ML8_F1]|nr:MAG: C4-dicarboxylate ABC transporter substrate-binding protein [delta proteobacterium ML8_F1]